MPALDRDMNVIGAVIAFDAVFGDQLLRQVEGLDRHVEQSPGVVESDLRGERLLAGGDPEDGLAAAAAGRTVADAACLEQGDSIAAPRQVQRSRAARDAAADHGDIGLDISAQGLPVQTRLLRRQRRGGGGGGGVVRIGGRVR